MYYKVIETKIEERDGKVYQVKELEPITDPLETHSAQASVFKALFLIDLFGDRLKGEHLKIDE